MELKKPQTFSSPAHTKAMDISQLLVPMASDGYETNWDGFVRIRRRIHFLCQQVLLEGISRGAVMAAVAVVTSTDLLLP
jgi:hypothetical protein